MSRISHALYAVTSRNVTGSGKSGTSARLLAKTRLISASGRSGQSDVSSLGSEQVKDVG